MSIQAKVVDQIGKIESDYAILITHLLTNHGQEYYQKRKNVNKGRLVTNGLTVNLHQFVPSSQ